MEREHGFSLVELLIVVSIITIIAAVAVPSLISSKVAANESSAISSVRTITTAQFTYAATLGSGTYSADLPTLQGASLIDNALGGGSKDGYNFTTSSGADTFTVTAVPVDPGVTGERGFFSDQTGVIRYNDSGAAGPADPPVGG